MLRLSPNETRDVLAKQRSDAHIARLQAVRLAEKELAKHRRAAFALETSCRLREATADVSAQFRILQQDRIRELDTLRTSVKASVGLAHRAAARTRLDETQKKDRIYDTIATWQQTEGNRFTNALHSVRVHKAHYIGKQRSAIIMKEQAAEIANARSVYQAHLAVTDREHNLDRITTNLIFTSRFDQIRHSHTYHDNYSHTYYNRSQLVDEQQMLVKRHPESSSQNALTMANVERQRKQSIADAQTLQLTLDRKTAKLRGQKAIHKLFMNKEHTMMLTVLNNVNKKDQRRRQELISQHIRTRNVEIQPSPQPELERRFEDLFLEKASRILPSSGHHLHNVPLSVSVDQTSEKKSNTHKIDENALYRGAEKPTTTIFEPSPPTSTFNEKQHIHSSSTITTTTTSSSSISSSSWHTQTLDHLLQDLTSAKSGSTDANSNKSWSSMNTEKLDREIKQIQDSMRDTIIK